MRRIHAEPTIGTGIEVGSGQIHGIMKRLAFGVQLTTATGVESVSCVLTAGCGEWGGSGEGGEIEWGRFPQERSENPDDAIAYEAEQIGIDRTEIAFYEFTGRTSKAHRVQICEALGFRECGVAAPNSPPTKSENRADTT